MINFCDILYRAKLLYVTTYTLRPCAHKDHRRIWIAFERLLYCPIALDLNTPCHMQLRYSQSQNPSLLKRK